MITFLILLIFTLLNLISKKSLNDREKFSPFECGFDPKNSARLPFSIHFFMIAIIFVIFDVELTLILPFSIILKSSNFFMLTTIFSFFIFILILGTYHEINLGSLNWKF
uniref:NADH-ubiquinone oxidoreductase chain 3 n=1 Tax=Curculionidae sp. BMNH 1040049 TaxID=1903777 RepID=A0A343A5W9_9CUCU|nr:NADH dehydrogenase subunit 3 [Curculionidae sp. BMNH 1040049]